MFNVNYPDAKQDIYGGLFKTLRETEIGENAGEAILAAIKQRQIAIKLSEEAYKFTNGLSSTDVLAELTAQLSKPVDTTISCDFVSDDLQALVDATIASPGLRWRLDCLNKSLGSLRQGDFGFVFARPETGKTTFLADQSTYMMTQTDAPVIWFNNEEEHRKVKLRAIQSHFGITLTELLGNLERYNKEFNAKYQGRFLIPNANFELTKSNIERLVEKVKPGLIIYDQIDKIKGFKADRDDLVYGYIYQWARDLAKAYCPSVGVCQADGTAEGQKWLTMAHVANAKTSKQAEADWILGIGKTHEESAEYIRYFNISKNKLYGDKDTIESLRHGRMEVLLEPVRARYKDIVEYN